MMPVQDMEIGLGDELNWLDHQRRRAIFGFTRVHLMDDYRQLCQEKFQYLTGSADIPNSEIIYASQ